MNNSPSFQFYAGDWIKSRSVRLMDAEQRGWYIQLLAEAWDGNPQCMLPKDDATLMRLACVSEEASVQPTFNARWMLVRNQFQDRGDYIANERQLECLATQTHNRKMAVKAGLKSAQNRDRKRKDIQKALLKIVTDSNGRSTDVDDPLNGESTERQRKVNSLSPTPTPTPTAISNTHTSVSDFDLFWQVYPKKTGKKEALRSWLKAKDKPDIKEIILAIQLQHQSDQWRKDGGQYIPNPSTWLNQGRWDDQPKGDNAVGVAVDFFNGTCMEKRHV